MKHPLDQAPNDPLMQLYSGGSLWQEMGLSYFFGKIIKKTLSSPGEHLINNWCHAPCPRP